MSERRQNDPSAYPLRYRSERLQEEGGHWYFCTREENLEGPFGNKSEAMEALQTYRKIMQTGLLPLNSCIHFTYH